MVNHPDADAFTNESVVNSPALRAIFENDDLQRILDENQLDDEFRDQMESVLKGTNEQWKLVHIEVCSKRLKLDFANTCREVSVSGAYRSNFVCFHQQAYFDVFVDRLDTTVPDRYEIRFDPENEIAIDEYRNGILRLMMRIDGEPSASGKHKARITEYI